MMDVEEIQDSLLPKLGKNVKYIGILNSDEVSSIKIPSIRNIPIIFIANTLTSNTDSNVMGHWVVFYIEKSPISNIIFFDSYGISPELYCAEFDNFIKNNSSFTLYTFNNQLQPNNSVKCGLYVLFFVHSVSHFGIRQTISNVKSIFSYVNLQSNDRYVLRYYHSNLNRKSCNWWKIGKKRAITYSECINLNKKNNE